jgi:hypothetical protein
MLTPLIRRLEAAGYTALYEGDRKPGPILEAACWVHARGLLT